MRFMRLIAFFMVALCLVSCSRDPKKVRQSYLQSGNKYFDRGKYKEASIMYRNALRTDPKFGEAFYHLALTELKLQHLANVVPALRRAIELLPPNSNEYIDSNVRLANILIMVARGGDRSSKPALEEARGIRDLLLKRNPNSFEGTKLQGDLDELEALQFAAGNKAPETKQKMEEAISTYRKALQFKPSDIDTMLALARTLSLYAELGEAEQLYKEIIDKDKDGLPAYMELYRLYFAQGKRPEAENILKRAIATHPSDYTLQNYLAQHYRSVGNRPEMTKVLNNLKSHFKDYPQAYLRVGDFYFRIGDAEQAMRQWEEGMNADSSHKVDYQKRIVEALIRQGKTAQAYEKTLEILKANPKDVDARSQKASFLLDKGEVEAAATELQSVVTANPNDFVARFTLGRTYFAKGGADNIEQARLQFESALKLRPDYTPARQALTQVDIRQGNFDRALKNAQETLRLNPRDNVSALLEAEALSRKGAYDQARALLDRIIKANPNQPDTLVELGLLNLTQRRYKEAEEFYRKAYAVDPSNPRGLLGVAEVYFQQNEPDKAIQVIADEVKKQPQRTDLKKELAVAETRARQFDKALADYQSIVDRYKDAPLEQADLYSRLGTIYSVLRDYPKAIENMQKARQLAPANWFYSYSLAMYYDNVGRQQEAVTSYRDAMKVDPNNAIVLNNLAYLLTQTNGNLDEALTLAQRAKQQLPNLTEISDTIGWIYLKKNLSDSAIEIFRDLNGKVKENPTFHYHYAMALAQKGDKAHALLELKAALQYKPSKNEENQIKELVQKLS